MKSAGRVLLLLVLLGLVLLVGRGVYVYLLPRWVAVLFYTYMLMGAFVIGYGIRAAIAALKNRTTVREKYPEILGQVSQTSDLIARFQRSRDYVALPLRVVAHAIAWPVDTMFGILLGRRNGGKKMTLEEVGIRQMSGLPEYYYSLYALAAALAIFGLEYRGVTLGTYGSIVLFLLIAITSLRHACYSIETTPLPANLRRSSTNPYAAFLLIVAADLATLVLALTAVMTTKPLSQVTLQELRAMGNELIHAEDTLWKVLKGAKLTVNEYVVGAIGLLFYLALVKILLEYKEFRRKDEDYVWLAAVASRLGNFATALRHLNNVKSWSSEAYSAKMIALIGVNQLEEAEKQSRLLLEHEHRETSPEGIFSTLWQGYLLAPVPEDIGTALLQRAVDLKVRDTLVQDSVLVETVKPRTQESRIELFSAAKEAFPLTLARLKIVAGDPGAALAILKQMKPAFPLDEIVALVLQASAVLIDRATTLEQDILNFRQWAALSVPRIKVLMKEPLEPWERVVVFTELQRTLLFARNLAPERVEELTFLSDSVKAATEGAGATRGIKMAELQYKELVTSK